MGLTGDVRAGVLTAQGDDGSYVRFTKYGVRLASLTVPDRTGNLVDVVTGYDSD